MLELLPYRLGECRRWAGLYERLCRSAGVGYAALHASGPDAGAVDLALVRPPTLERALEVLRAPAFSCRVAGGGAENAVLVIRDQTVRIEPEAFSGALRAALDGATDG